MRVFDLWFNCMVSAWFNDTEDWYDFFDAMWGPHGCVRPGYWQVCDKSGFSIEVPCSEFVARYKLIKDSCVQDN
jgi:hypothetical protein